MEKSRIKYVVKKGKRFFRGSGLWTIYFDDAHFYDFKIAREIAEFNNAAIIQVRIMVME